jgi:hypothetical protein
VSAGAAATPGIRPFGLARADQLKLRRRRGLFWTVTVLTIVPMVIAYGVLAILHAANPDHHGPAGGVENLGHGMFVLTLLGGVAAILAGARAGADDVASGVFRELVVTGRPRVVLFGSRIPGGLAFVLPFVACGYGIAAIAATAATEFLPAPSATLLIQSGLWILANVGFYFVLSVGVASVINSRAYTIGILLAWRMAVGPILASIGALGIYRAAVPDVGFDRLAPSGVREYVTGGSGVGLSAGTAVYVLLLWLAAAAGAGAWRTATRDA